MLELLYLASSAPLAHPYYNLCMQVNKLNWQLSKLIRPLVENTSNILTLEQGYEAFDVDKDGKVSLQDLQAAVTNMEMSIDASSVEELFEHLDPDKLGYISQDNWKDKLAAAYAEEPVPAAKVPWPVFYIQMASNSTVHKAHMGVDSTLACVT